MCGYLGEQLYIRGLNEIASSVNHYSATNN